MAREALVGEAACELPPSAPPEPDPLTDVEEAACTSWGESSQNIHSQGGGGDGTFAAPRAGIQRLDPLGTTEVRVLLAGA